MRLFFIGLISSFMCTSAFAQSISIEDLQKQINAELENTTKYEDFLNDPDPKKSWAAMKVMLRSGDPVLVRMAKEYGIFSPSKATQKAALDGYFASGPVLDILFDGGKESDQTGFRYGFKQYSGSVSATSIGFIQVVLGKYNEKNRCFGVVEWPSHRLDNGCFLRNSDNGVSIYLWERWSKLVLNDKGGLIGSGVVYNIRNIPISIQVAQ